jgi:hypothetical protein
MRERIEPAGIPSVHGGEDVNEGLRYEQANEASPASLMFTAPTQSALAEKPHSTHTNLVCVLRFSAEVCWHSGHLRLVFWDDTTTRRPPFHCVLYSSWRRSSNFSVGLAE